MADPNQQAEGQRTFIHHPTTSDVVTNVQTVYDINIGEDPEMEYYFEEMRRRHLSIVLNSGQDMFLLPLIRTGTRCPFWKSEEAQCDRPLDPRAACYNTGWIGGYHPPMLIKIVVPPVNQTAVRWEAGNRIEMSPRPWTIHVPKIQQRDVMVSRADGDRFEIGSVSQTLFRGQPMHQEFELRKLTRDKESFIYSVPVPGVP